VCPDAHFYQAASSEMFGKINENTAKREFKVLSTKPLRLCQGICTLGMHQLQESYGMHASNGILFNHESPRRGIEFVTRKITDGVARIYHGLANELRLGNLDG